MAFPLPARSTRLLNCSLKFLLLYSPPSVCWSRLVTTRRTEVLAASTQGFQMNLQALQTLGQRVFNTTREKIVGLKKEVGHYWSAAAAAAATEQPDQPDADAEVKEHLSERSISSYLLHISAAAVALKALHYFVKREWLLTLVTVISSVLAAPQWIWSAVTSLTWAFAPVTCGVAMTVVTWYTVFLDSCIPGVYPPSPKVERKLWFPFPSTFHLGYSIALVNGFLLSILIYLGMNK